MRKGVPIWIMIFVSVFTGCRNLEVDLGNLLAEGTAISRPFEPTLTPFQPLPPTPIISPTPDSNQREVLSEKPIPGALHIWIDPAFPGAVALPPLLARAEIPEAGDIRLEIGNDNKVSEWVYALVAPFPEIRDGITTSDLQAIWHGDREGPSILVSAETSAAFSQLWGEGDSRKVSIIKQENLLTQIWNRRPALAIVPFESLVPQWKVLEVDGQSPVRKDFDSASYPLIVPYSLHGDARLVESIRKLYGTEASTPLVPPSNREAEKLTVVVMTGVTALVRATAWTMEQQGITYPAQDIGNWLTGADITHISNEVPFAENCPYPDPVQIGVVFCSRPEYIDLLKEVGTDVVELTGDHFHDWGPEAMLFTLSLYDREGWLYYGGGANNSQGRKPVTLEHNGNRIAFIGCNGKGGAFAQASATTPGSVKCDFSWMQAKIAELTQDGYLVIATFQHFEYYSYRVPPAMMEDFRKMAESGAVIVSGSQAHHPHGFEFHEGGFLHFGLGNLFFDQYSVSPNTRKGFIDRHVFYNGKHISTELLTMVFVDFARPRPMNRTEREDLLRDAFSSSGW